MKPVPPRTRMRSGLAAGAGFTVFVASRVPAASDVLMNVRRVGMAANGSGEVDALRVTVLCKRRSTSFVDRRCNTSQKLIQRLVVDPAHHDDEIAGRIDVDRVGAGAEVDECAFLTKVEVHEAVIGLRCGRS